MLYEFHEKTLGLVLAFALLIAGAPLSVTGLEGSSAEAYEASPVLTASMGLGNCQIMPSLDFPCSDHSNAANNHCQHHCGHALTGVLSKLNPISPGVMHRKVKQNSQRIPESAALSPGFRPPNI